jgi:hypothetical protein
MRQLCSVGNGVRWYATGAMVLVMASATGVAYADSIFVATHGSNANDGSARAPVRTITKGLEVARSIRSASNAAITLHVGAGVYRVSRLTAAIDSDPTLEHGPLLFNVSKMTVIGRTTPEVDALGVPTGRLVGTEQTVITVNAGEQLGQATAMSMVGSTVRASDGTVFRGDDVRLRKLTFLGVAAANNFPGATELLVDRAQRVTIEDCHFMGGVNLHAALFTRLSSVTLASSHVGPGKGTPLIMSGGTTADPAYLVVRQNRVVSSGGQNIYTTPQPAVLLPYDANEAVTGFRLPPIADELIDPDPEHPPDFRVGGDIVGNHLSGATGFTVRFATVNLPDGGVPVLGFVSVAATKGSMMYRLRGNHLGAAQAGWWLRPFHHSGGDATLRYSATVRLEIEGNTYASPTKAIISFESQFDSPDGAELDLKQARYEVIDAQNELGLPPAITLLHPATDRTFAPAVVENDNILTINGTVIPAAP